MNISIKKQAEDLRRPLKKKRHPDVQQVQKKMIHTVNLQGNANKTTIRYHLTHARKVIIKKTGNKKCWQRCGGKGDLKHFVRMQISAFTMKNSMEIPQINKNITTI